MAVEFQLLQYQPPVIQVNFEEMEEYLKKTLKDYEGLVVTESTLPGCRNAKKELASARKKIDTYRKEKKKELNQPIVEFETKCKKLISLIEEAEKPINAGIKVYDDKRREAKKQEALALIEEIIEQTGLNDKWKKMLDVLPKYMNLTATTKEVREDIENRAFALKVEQDREQERLEIINQVIEGENERITSQKITMSDYRKHINSGMSTQDIIAIIKKQGEAIYQAEHAPKPEEKPIQAPESQPVVKEEPKEDPRVLAPEPKKTVQYYQATYVLVGTADELRSVSAFLKENNISYKVTDQRYA